MVLILLPIGSLAYLYLSDPIIAARYIGMFTLEDGDYSILTPRMLVTGDTPRNIPVAQAGERTIRPEALEEMIQFAIKHRSYSLIVIHEGVIQEEWYADGWNRDRLTGLTRWYNPALTPGGFLRDRLYLRLLFNQSSQRA